MPNYHELCRCGHTRYLHAWVPDPKDFDPDNPRCDCQSCDCKKFAGTGAFSFDLETRPASPENLLNG